MEEIASVDSFSGCEEKYFSQSPSTRTSKVGKINFKVWITNGEHTSLSNFWWSHLKVYSYQSWMIFVLNKYMNFQLTKFYTIITLQPLKQFSSKKRLARSSECVSFQNVKITCSENAWDFKFTKSSCSEVCMFCSIHSHLYRRIPDMLHDTSGTDQLLEMVASHQ